MDRLYITNVTDASKTVPSRRMFLISRFLSIGMSASRRTRYLVSASGDADTRGQRINENPLGRASLPRGMFTDAGAGTTEG